MMIMNIPLQKAYCKVVRNVKIKQKIMSKSKFPMLLHLIFKYPSFFMLKKIFFFIYFAAQNLKVFDTQKG